MRLKELTFAFKNCYHHDRGISLITPLSTRRGVGGEAPSSPSGGGARGRGWLLCCCLVVWLFGCFAFSFCKVNHDFFKNQHFSGYTSSKFCKDARNQLSHRKIAKVDYAREGESPHLTPASTTTRPRNTEADNGAEKIAITKS